MQLSHAATRPTVRIALIFVLAAAISAAFGATPWMVVHLFLAGGAGLAISSVTVMLTVTWAAAPAPSARLVAVQRAAVAFGAAGVVLTREVERFPDWSTGIPGAAYIAGLGLLVFLLLATVRKGQERRFDVAVAFYVTAALAALVAVGVGIYMASSGVTLELRGVHVVLNLLGFVGLTMAGSLPFFAATVGRSRMAPSATPFRLALLLGAFVASLGVTVAGLIVESKGLIFVGFGGYLYGIITVYCFVPRPTKRQLTWAGPRLVALWCGGVWWLGVLAVTAYEVIDDDQPPFLERWTHVLIVGAFAQIIWGSLAYLIPMLRGGGPKKLSEGFAQTRSWPGFAGINASAVAFALEERTVGVVVLMAVVADGVWRTLSVGLTRSARPDEGGPSGSTVEPDPA